MFGAYSTSLSVEKCWTSSIIAIKFTIPMPRKAITSLFLTYKTSSPSASFVKYDLLLGMCFKLPDSNVHLVEFGLVVVTDRALDVHETISQTVCLSPFPVVPLSFGQPFKMRPMSPPLKHFLPPLLFWLSLSALFLWHSRTIWLGLPQ